MNVLAQKEGSHLFDEVEFNSEAVQRVWQYLRRFNKDPRRIQEFYFDAERTEGSPKDCLKTLIRFEFFFQSGITLVLEDCQQKDLNMSFSEMPKFIGPYQKSGKICFYQIVIAVLRRETLGTRLVPFLTKMLTFGYSQLGFKDCKDVI